MAARALDTCVDVETTRLIASSVAEIPVPHGVRRVLAMRDRRRV